jgi:hypothetical protein
MPAGAVARRPLAVTTGEQRDRAADLVPQRYRGLDLAAQLPAAGFAEVRVREMPAWHKTERTLWEAAVALDPGDDPGLQQMREEAEHVLARFDIMRRVLATATAAVDYPLPAA